MILAVGAVGYLGNTLLPEAWFREVSVAYRRMLVELYRCEWGGVMEENARLVVLSDDQIKEWGQSLVEREASSATVGKYLHDVRVFQAFMAQSGLELCKQSVIAYKEALVESYAPASVNSMLAAVNGFLSFIGSDDLRVKRLRIQQGPSMSSVRSLSVTDYKRLVRAARKQGNECAALIAQTLASTGIRVSELAAITVEAVKRGFAEVTNKGKTRRVWLPKELARRLELYALQRKVKRGSVFVSRTGRPIDRTRVWRLLKQCGLAAGVDLARVYPHALRHLFATCYWQASHDMHTLSSVLGHSRVDTTRIYINTDGQKIKKIIEGLGLVI